MESVFGKPWRDLDLGDIERFLQSAERESLLWEAKGGGAKPSPGSIQKQVCGFANSLGGYLILGADEQESAWVLTGIDFAGSEPQRWIADCIGALRPRPACDVKLFPTDKGTVAVIQVEAVTVPPCMTPPGNVFERVAGATVPVKEPLVLLDLTTRGRELREKARQTAKSRALALLQTQDEHQGHEPVFSLALKAVGPPPDIDSGPSDRPSLRRWSNGRIAG
jgi:hypothetical protein